MDKIQNSDAYGLKRLESKNAKNAIIQKLAQDFNLTPIIAEAFYKQVSIYFNEHSNISLPTKLFVQLNQLVSTFASLVKSPVD